MIHGLAPNGMQGTEAAMPVARLTLHPNFAHDIISGDTSATNQGDKMDNAPEQEQPTLACGSRSPELISAESGDIAVVETKEMRVALDAILQRIKDSPRRPGWAEERGHAAKKIIEAIMWLGMDLKAIGTPNPYPNSYNPGNAVVDKTADGLKL